MASVYHAVRPGDTLSRIGKLYGVPWPSIAKLNSIGSPYTIHVGEILLVHNEEITAAPSYLIVDGPWTANSDPTPYRKQWIIVHDPGTSNVPLERITTAVRLSRSPRVSYHEILGEVNGKAVINRLVPYDRAAWHAGRESRIPGTTIVDYGVNLRTYSVSVNYPMVERLYPVLVARLCDLVERFAMPDAGVILAHHEVATYRSDPRLPGGRNMNDLRRSVHDELLRRQVD